MGMSEFGLGLLTDAKIWTSSWILVVDSSCSVPCKDSPSKNLHPKKSLKLPVVQNGKFFEIYTCTYFVVVAPATIGVASSGPTPWVGYSMFGEVRFDDNISENEWFRKLGAVEDCSQLRSVKRSLNLLGAFEDCKSATICEALSELFM